MTQGTPPRSDAPVDGERERHVAEALAAWLADKEEGRPHTEQAYEAKLGDDYGRFLELIAVERHLDLVLGPPAEVEVPARGGRLLRFAVPMAIAATVLLAVGAFFWMRGREATFDVRTFPTARVVVDGEDRGASPLRVHLTPGPHEVRLLRAGFAEHSLSIQAESGAEQHLEEVLIPVEPRDPGTLAALEVSLLGYQNPRDLAPPSGHRGTADTEKATLLPTGRVLLSELDRTDVWLPEVGTAGPIRLAFRLGEEEGSEVLEGASVEPLDLHLALAVPEAVRARARPGTVIHVQLLDASDRPLGTSRIEVVAEGAAEGLDLLSRRTRKLPDPTRAWLEGLLLLERGLPSAAWRRAREAARLADGEPDASPLPWLIMREALQDLGLLDSTPGEDVLLALEALRGQGR